VSIRLSFQVAVIAVGVLAVVTVPLAWALARTSFPVKQALLSTLLLPLVLPPTVLGYYLVVVLGTNGILGRPLYQTTGWTLMFSWWGAAVASAVVGFPLLFQTSYVAMCSVAHELEDTACTMGASRWQTFWYVSMPLAKRGVLAGIALAFARSMGEFGATLMLAGNIPGRTVTMPLAVYNVFAAGKLSQADTLVVVYTFLNLVVLICLAGGTRWGLFRAEEEH
jgi:molybdate transport system permease protein